MSKVIFFASIFLAFVFISCKKNEVKKKYVYEVDALTIRKSGNEKKNVKSTTEFISITFSDLFGTTINSATLLELSNTYSAFGDKKLVEDIIIRNFLNSSAVVMPTSSVMRSNIEKFVADCYKKFYNREPNEHEKWFLSNLLTQDQKITPEQVYYSFLTSNEYRYY